MRFRLWVIIASVLFVIGIGAGIAVSATMPASIVALFTEELTALEELVAALGPFQVTTAIFIFFKNVLALLISYIFSPILCLLPVLTLVLNGSLLSFVSVLVAQEESVGFVLSGLLPHGIFEIPALIIGGAAALHFGAMVIMALFSRERRNILPGFKQNIRYLLIAFALLVPAAIIETFVTPLLMQ